jgi:RNA polymerase sigma factor (sigma-70 family)
MDSDQLGRLIDQHAAALELYARQWSDAAEDVVQVAFLKLGQQTRPPDNAAAWLFRAVRNGAINAAMAARRRRRHESDAASARPWFRDPIDPDHPDALDPAVAESELQGLPLEQREVIVAHLWGGLTFEQIGQVSGTSSSTAHRLYAAGLSALRERLGVSCHRSRPNRSES